MLRKKLKLNDDRGYFNNINNVNNQVDTNIFTETTSQFFVKPYWSQLYEIECELNENLKPISFPNPIAAVYNPTIYASKIHCDYLQKFCSGPKDVLFLGMNPGPWGMVQTGVPFGYIPAVRDWLGLVGDVEKPEQELSCRPVTGLNCDKLERSGKIFWGLLEKLCETPENFFRNCFIHNYCPLAFFKSSGTNVTPSEIKGNSKKELQTLCSESLAKSIELLSPKIIIAIGCYIEDRVKELIKNQKINTNIILKRLPHPSPRSLNNHNWPEVAEKWFHDNDIIKYF